MQYFVICLMVLAVLSIIVNCAFLTTGKVELVMKRTRGQAVVCIFLGLAYIAAYYQLYQMITS